MQLLAVLDELKAVAAGVPGVEVVALGINQAWPATPAVEVIAGDVDLRTLAAGNLEQLVNGRVLLACYVALTANLEDDERLLVPIVENLVAAMNAPAFDRTLGGLVEDVRPVGASFDVVRRNNRTYRSAVVEVIVGDLDNNT